MDIHLTRHNKTVWSTLLKALVAYQNNSSGQFGAEEQKRFTDHYPGDLQRVIEQWHHRESDFEFLESSSTPDNISQCMTLLKTLRAVSEQSQEINELNLTRLAEGRSLLPSSWSSHTSTIEELTFIEELYDEEIIELAASTLKVDSSEIIDQLLSMIRHHLMLFCVAYEEIALNKEEDPLNSVSWLAYPCKSCKIDSWREHLEYDEYQFKTLGHAELLESLNHFHKEWHQAWRVSDWDDGLCWQGKKGGKAANSIWSEVIEPFSRELVSGAIIKRRNADLISDLNQCFVDLIDAKRPKDQRIGSFWINQDKPSEITVIFLTRDGKLLAQRDLSWNPDVPESIIEAFKIINIRLLTYPEGFDKNHPHALRHLQSLYQLHAVSTLVLDPVPHPQSLTPDAQKALRIGQRFVAPLRFWARTDLLELMRCFSNPIVFECLERSQVLSSLLNVLRDSCAERWLILRRKRKTYVPRERTSRAGSVVREIIDPKRSEHTLSTENKSITHYRRGDEVSVKVVKCSNFTLHVKVLETTKYGIIRLPKHFNNDIDEGQVLQVFVLGMNPKDGVLTLSLRPSLQTSNTARSKTKVHASDTGQESNSSLVPKEPQKNKTLERLNNLFSQKENTQLTQRDRSQNKRFS